MFSRIGNIIANSGKDLYYGVSVIAFHIVGKFNRDQSNAYRTK